MKIRIYPMVWAAVWTILLFAADLNASDAATATSPANGTVTITESTPSFGQVLDRGSTINFSGTISFSLNNASSGTLYVGLLPFPSDNNTSRLITINIFSLKSSAGTVPYSGSIKVERDSSDTTTQLRSFKVRAILFHPDYLYSEMISDTQPHPVFGTLSLDMLITILRVMSGLSPTEDAMKNIGDVSRDGKIGLEEAFYVMQKIAGLR